MLFAATSNAVAVDGAPRTGDLEKEMASEGTTEAPPVTRHARGGGWIMWRRRR
jgi:hypothetical protein